MEDQSRWDVTEWAAESKCVWPAISVMDLKCLVTEENPKWPSFLKYDLNADDESISLAALCERPCASGVFRTAALILMHL